MTQKIGPREQHLRELRERQYSTPASRPTIEDALRKQIASIPATKARSQKKKRR